MTRVILASAVAVALAALAASPRQPDLVVVFSGDIRGYLSPCGCTKPQIGGVKRLASVVRTLREGTNVLYVDLGNWTEAKGRQDQLKADALAELFSKLKPDYLNVGAVEARLDPATLAALDQMSGGHLASDVLTADFLQPMIHAPILGLAPPPIGGTLPARKPEEALSARTDALIVLYAGDRASAVRLAESTPGDGRLLIYSHRGDPPREPMFVNGWALVTPGDKCRFVGRIERVGGEWKNLRLFELGPEHRDDSEAHAIYQSYLMRVGEENLLDQVPRLPSKAKYVGSEACKACHVNAWEVWAHSAHANAYATLEETMNHRDPECVGCHVVGLTTVSGFISKEKTPDLKDVGCESCHGPGSEHIIEPTVSMKAGEASCMSCHVPDHSPGFDFAKYWEKIRH
jgi:hypothetical protein